MNEEIVRKIRNEVWWSERSLLYDCSSLPGTSIELFRFCDFGHDPWPATSDWKSFSSGVLGCTAATEHASIV